MATAILCLAVILLVCLLIIEKNKLKDLKQKNDELERWRKIALVDDLTGIANRAAYSEQIQEIKKTKSSGANLAIILFDIDNFKQINDTEGHLEGDRILKECAKMLTEIFSNYECCVYRIGGDEFAVIFEDIQEDSVIDTLLKIKEYEEKHQDFRLSKGYSLAQGKKDFDKMFSLADEMLYADKNSKKIALG